MSIYAARIEAVTDSLGHEIRGIETLQEPHPLCVTTHRLHPGDQVLFTCKGIDPLARPITWTICHSINHDIATPLDDYAKLGPQSVLGDQVEFCWTVPEHAAGTPVLVQVTMTSQTADHRWSDSYDGSANFLYSAPSAIRSG
jgi:hypothetical protein